MSHRQFSGVKRPTLAYVLGTTDCGSTLLAFMLDIHPSICALGEPPKRAIRRRGVPFRCSCGSTIGGCAFWQSLFGELGTRGFDFSESRWPNDYHYLNDLANRLLMKHQVSVFRRAAQRLLGGVVPGHARVLRRATQATVAFVDAALAQTGKHVFLDTSKSLFRFQQLRRVEEWELKVVRMVRDVRWFAFTKRNRLSAVEAARQWRTYQVGADRVLQDVAPENQIVVRYEDLCHRRRETLHRLHAFLGVSEQLPLSEYNPARHHLLGDGIGGPFTVSTDEPWRRELVPAARSAVMDVAGDVSRRYGYV